MPEGQVGRPAPGPPLDVLALVHLVTDRCSLAFRVCTSKEEARLRSGRTNDHPALGSSVVGERRGVLNEVEAEYAGEERNGRVVLVNDQGTRSIGTPAAYRGSCPPSRRRALTAADPDVRCR